MTPEEKQAKIDSLERIVSKYSNDPSKSKMVADAKAKLADLRGDSPKEDVPNCPDAITEALKAIEDALALMEGQGGGKGLDIEALKLYLKTFKINIDNLGDDVKALIGKTQKFQFETPKGKMIETDQKLPEVFFKAYSDLKVGNNVYLYGGAGTGKTRLAEQLAIAMNYTLITINCNQFTSPMEVKGGQTIDGYQEGKLITAWANLTSATEGVVGGMQEGTEGCLLLLDELPKIDPNTAGTLNDALAKTKNPEQFSSIENDRGERFQRKNFACIATGNAPLNKEEVDYVANNKQDLSLQDRFIGSTYEIFVDIETERQIMDEFLFIFNFMNSVRALIQSDRGKEMSLQSQAFVSLRIMQSLMATWVFWKENHEKENGDKVKTIVDGIDGFFDLFEKTHKEWLINESNYDEFKRITLPIQIKNPIGYNSEAEIEKANKIVKEFIDKRSQS